METIENRLTLTVNKIIRYFLNMKFRPESNLYDIDFI